jgi:xanthine/CO dehydrogenase XdhC/CoxF family maturation factor
VKYGITADEAHRFGLPCGGTLELLLEYDPDAASLDAAGGALEQGKLMQRTVRLPPARCARRSQGARGAHGQRHPAGQHLRPRVPHAADRRRPAAEYLATMACSAASP